MENRMNLDANSLLNELDKGLLSGRMGEECEAIVGFPWLFIRYPFPILINAASLKLANNFFYSSNFSRLLILKVMRQAEKHLDKIINLDEFVRRLFNVTYSNDPIARGITLRTLGTISRIIPEAKNVHHTIRNSLDAQDEMESMAAIEAAAAFAKQSSNFALSIYPKILAMISKNETPIEAKISALNVLHHTHYDSALAADLRTACQALISRATSAKFVAASLQTLTYIASTSLLFIPEHIELLLRYFREDRRLSVKTAALRELRCMAKSSSHLWSQENVEGFLTYIENVRPAVAAQPAIYRQVISTFVHLLESPGLLITESTGDVKMLHERLIKLFLTNIEDKNDIKLTALCFQLCSALSVSTESVLDETLEIIRILLERPTLRRTNLDIEADEAYRQICISMVRIGNTHPLVTGRIVNLLVRILSDPDFSKHWLCHLCHVLCALKHLQPDPALGSLVIQLIIFHSRQPDETMLTRLCTLYFQLCSRAQQRCQSQFIEVIKLAGNPLLLFRLIRQSMRYGHHQVSAALCQQMEGMTSSENSHFWMLSLGQISAAESLLQSSTGQRDLAEHLPTAIGLYCQSLDCLRAALSTASNPTLLFATEYVKIRYKYLQTHAQLRAACNLVRSQPAPSVAGQTALSTRDDLVRAGSIVTVMRRCAAEFRSLADLYSGLYQTSFNADDETLVHLELVQHSCTIVAEAIESIFQTNRLSTLFVNKDSTATRDRIDQTALPSVEHRQLVLTVLECSKIIATQLSGDQKVAGIDCKKISTLLLISTKMMLVPLCVPRSFFQSIQTTYIKLALSPQPKSSEFIVSQNNSNFALKVEGVVVYGTVFKELRKVAKIMLTVTTSIANKSPFAGELGLVKGNETCQTLQSLVQPFNDYFQEQFLLPLTIPGLYNINVEAAIIDDNDAQWKTGPIASLSTKVLDN